MYCRVCGKELPEGAVRCDECGTPVDGTSSQTGGYEKTGGYGEAGVDQQNENGSRQYSFDTGDGYYQDNRNRYDDSYRYDDGQEPVYERQSGARKGFAITSMVLGIIGIVSSCCSLFTYGILNILLGVVGLIFGILGLKSQGKGMAIAGIVMACINLLIGILLMVIMVASTGLVSGMTPEEYEQFMWEMENMFGEDMIGLRSLLQK